MKSEIFTPEDKKYMQRCIQLAKNGKGLCSPNPMVGAVIVKDGIIIGEGWHQKAGMPHAEPVAINSVKNQELLKSSTLYVSLEPCSHYGKTPPCVDLIIKKGIPRVVIGCLDVFPLVSGSGVKKLKAAGVEVLVGPEMQACLDLNRKFFTYHAKKRPYIMLKWAQTSDGFIDNIRKPDGEELPLIISTPLTKIITHKLRSEFDAILVGTNTAMMDNPKLNVRDWSGKNPVRCVTDRNLTLSKNLNIFDGTTKTIVFTEKSGEGSENVSYETINFEDNLVKNILESLYKKGIQSLLVEGGAKLHNAFLNAGLWDELHVESAPFTIGKGVPAPDLSGAKYKKLTEHRLGTGDEFRIVKEYSSTMTFTYNFS